MAIDKSENSLSIPAGIVSDTRGSGYDALTKWYYAWKFYGSKSNYRYYNFAYSGKKIGGELQANGLYKLGDIFYTTTDSRGTNAPSTAFTTMENRTLNGVIVGSTLYYDPNSVVSYSYWNRPINTYNW